MRILLSFFNKALLFIVSDVFRSRPTRQMGPQKCRRPDDTITTAAASAIAAAIRAQRLVHIDTGHFFFLL